MTPAEGKLDKRLSLDSKAGSEATSYVHGRTPVREQNSSMTWSSTEDTPFVVPRSLTRDVPMVFFCSLERGRLLRACNSRDTVPEGDPKTSSVIHR